MVRLRRFIRPALVVSVLGHAAPALVLLPFLGAHPVEPPPHDAIVVDIVPPDEAPRFEGTPSDLRLSGTQSAASAPAPQQQAQQHSQPRHDASRAAAPPPTAQPVTAEADMVQAESEQPQEQTQEQPSEEQNQSAAPQAAPPQPHQDQPHQQTVAEMAMQFALAGGPLGGGFAAPAVNTNQADYDWTAEFRERVSSCSSAPAGVVPEDKVSIRLRIFLNRDGTVKAPPQLLEPAPSRKQLALMQSAREALQRCQPYTMLPPERYRQWKTLDFFIVPLRFTGRS